MAADGQPTRPSAFFNIAQQSAILASTMRTPPNAPIISIVERAEEVLGLEAGTKKLYQRSADCYDVLYSSNPDALRAQLKQNAVDHVIDLRSDAASIPDPTGYSLPDSKPHGNSALAVVARPSSQLSPGRFELCRLSMSGREEVKLGTVKGNSPRERGPYSFRDSPALESVVQSPGRAVNNGKGRMPINVGELNLVLLV